MLNEKKCTNLGAVLLPRFSGSGTFKHNHVVHDLNPVGLIFIAACQKYLKHSLLVDRYVQVFT